MVGATAVSPMSLTPRWRSRWSCSNASYALIVFILNMGGRGRDPPVEGSVHWLVEPTRCHVIRSALAHEGSDVHLWEMLNNTTAT